MFYWIFSLIFVVILSTYLILKFSVFKNSEKFSKIIKTVLKASVVSYCTLTILGILLPDAINLSLSEEELVVAIGMGSRAFAMLRWVACIPFIALPIAVFFDNRTFRNIATYLCVLITIANICSYETYLASFTSPAGRGLLSLPNINAGFKSFLLNPTFRSLWIGFVWLLEILVPIILAIENKHIFNVKSGKEWANFAIITPLIFLSSLPIYVPQHLIGYTSIIFKQYSWPQLIWAILIAIEGIVLYFIFRNRSEQDKRILLFVMALALIYQYHQMFGAIFLKLARLPLQLCNIASYLILLSLITKNKKLFDFTVVVNVVGVILAVAFPDLDGVGIGYLYNIHFIVEHTNVILIPILALAFKIFPRVKGKDSIKSFVVGFSIYFAIVLVLGATFNTIASATGDGFYSANYMFMFDGVAANKTLPGILTLFDIQIKIGHFVIYPIIFLLVYIVFLAFCFICFGMIQLIYCINDKIAKKKGITLQE